MTVTVKDDEGQENVASFTPTEFLKTISGNVVRGVVAKPT